MPFIGGKVAKSFCSEHTSRGNRSSLIGDASVTWQSGMSALFSEIETAFIGFSRNRFIELLKFDFSIFGSLSAENVLQMKKHL